ncbi:protein translocase SEC61 complex subunit gamma [archaeon]|nr:protein translocase SEC61 complex subunit gamma [archaeon]
MSWIKNKLIRLKEFYVESKRVFKVTKKPTKDEFKLVVKVSALGALIIGLMGFIIQVGYHLIK